MKSFRRSFLFLIVIAAALILAACGSDSDSEANQEGAAGQDEKIEMRLAGVYPPEHPTSENMEQFKEEVEENSDGQIEITTYPANQLGDYTVVYEEIMRGTIEMGLMTAPTEFDPNLNLNNVNYLATSYEEAEEQFAPGSYLYNATDEIHEGLGVKFLSFHFEGMTGIGSVDEINNPTDPTTDKGIMLRVPSIEMLREGAIDLGFRTVSVDYSELYQALQTGVADGWAGGSPLPNYTDVGDVINYYYAYNNWFETTHLLMNNDLWNELSEENQEIIENAVSNFYQRSLEQTEENDELYKEKLSDEKGVEIVEFSDEELQELGEHMRENNWPKLEDMIDEKYYEGLMEAYE